VLSLKARRADLVRGLAVAGWTLILLYYLQRYL
jgi:hypothetical protein